MADTPTSGETVVPEAPSNTPVQTPAPTPQGNASDTAEVERLRKEVEQANLRARQLENEKLAREKADEEAEAKRLESNQEYKTLLEQERAKREDLERAEEARTQKAELDAAKADVLKDFSEDVQKQAEDLGIDLSNAEEATVTSYKEKLTKLNDSFGSNGRPTSNNGRQTNPKYDEHEVLQAYAKGDNTAIEEAMNRIPWIADNIKQS
jgi:chromosome segregation ATPase